MPAAHAAGSEPGADSVIVVADATLGFRKKHMVSQSTRSHARYGALDDRFAVMEPYAEDGDLVGCFVTCTNT